MASSIFEVCYAKSDADIFHISLKSKSCMTVIEVLNYINFFSLYPEIDSDNLACGIFAKKVAPDYVMQNDDRLEIYRPLKVTPLAARRLRANSSK